MTEEAPIVFPVVNKQQVDAVTDVLNAALDIVSMHKSAFTPRKYLCLETWTGDKAVSLEVQLAALVEAVAFYIEAITNSDSQRMDGMIAWVKQRLWEECHYTLTLSPKDAPIPPIPNADIIILSDKSKTPEEEK
jgi:hypothetical protein